jgi:hypothetical protein
MTGAWRPAAYVLGLAALFAAALGAGAVFGSDGARRTDTESAHGGSMGDMADGEGGAHAHGGEHGSAPAGLAVADGGLRLIAPGTARAGVAERFAFRIADGDGATVRDFEVEHTKRLHFIAVRRDLTGFQHLHPEQAADGTWSTPLTLPDAGAWRVYADFTPRGGSATTLASDVLIAGDFAPRALPAAASATEVDGYDVALESVRDGDETTLTYKITRAGRPVAVEPYLGADGHLVALRAGDLAYLHVHPIDGDRTGEIAFAAHYPSAGSYRLFLQFQVGGRVHTAALTQEVGAA